LLPTSTARRRRTLRSGVRGGDRFGACQTAAGRRILSRRAFWQVGGSRILAQLFERFAVKQGARLMALHLDRLELRDARNAAGKRGKAHHLRCGEVRREQQHKTYCSQNRLSVHCIPSSSCRQSRDQQHW
jgi:hypothetical protein